jgi:hypothetical protein
MSKGISHGMAQAAKDHLLAGEPITRLEAIVMYGVANLPDVIKELRREGWIIRKDNIFYSEALVRLRRYATVVPPENLPIREIVITQYRVSK